MASFARHRGAQSTPAMFSTLHVGARDMLVMRKHIYEQEVGWFLLSLGLVVEDGPIA